MIGNIFICAGLPIDYLILINGFFVFINILSICLFKKNDGCLLLPEGYFAHQLNYEKFITGVKVSKLCELTVPLIVY